MKELSPAALVWAPLLAAPPASVVLMAVAGAATAMALLLGPLS